MKKNRKAVMFAACFIGFFPSLVSLSAECNKTTAFVLRGQPDVNHQVSQFVRASEGATLSTTDSEGNSYQLVIPPNALYADLIIKLTPASYTGLPGATKHIGVDISPAGTGLFGFARLKIQGPGLDNKHAYYFQTQGDAKELQATPALPSMDSDEILLSHFSGATLAIGSPELDAAVHDGVFDNSISWYTWQRDIVTQDYRNGRIDKLTYDAKMEIIERKCAEIKDEYIQKEIKKAQDAADGAIDRLKDHVQDPNPADTQAFVDDINIVINFMRTEELLGRDSSEYGDALAKVIKEFYKNLYANCDNQVYDAKTILKLERARQLFGGDDTDYNTEKCMGKRMYSIRGEYVYRLKSKPGAGVERYIDNVTDSFSVMLEAKYDMQKLNSFTPQIAEFSSPHTTAENIYDNPIGGGEGCLLTQQPMGEHEVFDLETSKSKTSGFYKPAFDFPPDVVLPPDVPRHVDASGNISVELVGLGRKLGWKFSTNDPDHCTENDRKPSIAEYSMNFNIDITKFPKTGTRIVDNQRYETDTEIGGWVFTYERAQ